ncbi:MAG TPA: Sir2 family NAD-dependent protein deacetylase [Atribacteraceae bacterium]|nr:Sir2 family NAD-dependent protein deacetylase [Atribacteraceae bacterium]
MTKQSEERRLARFILERAPWLVLTGAGISTESGIPDFRTPGAGLWEHYNPMALLSTETLNNDPETFYRIGYPVLRKFRDALPNPAHLVLADWERREWVRGVVTQNIDSLHIRAGSREVLEIHGHLRTGSCRRCRSIFPIDRLEEQLAKAIIPPRCLCGGLLRPDVVLFGDQLPDDFSKAQMLARSHPVLVVGSSLTVSPANLLPSVAPELVIVNVGPTPYDDRATYRFQEKAGVFFPRLHALLLGQ